MSLGGPLQIPGLPVVGEEVGISLGGPLQIPGLPVVGEEVGISLAPPCRLLRGRDDAAGCRDSRDDSPPVVSGWKGDHPVDSSSEGPGLVASEPISTEWERKIFHPSGVFSYRSQK
jgi:hypothetical protein